MTTEGLTKISYVPVNFGSDKKSCRRKANTIVRFISTGVRMRRFIPSAVLSRICIIPKNQTQTHPYVTITLILFVSHSEKGNLIPSCLVFAMLLGKKFLLYNAENKMLKVTRSNFLLHSKRTNWEQKNINLVKSSRTSIFNHLDEHR